MFPSKTLDKGDRLLIDPSGRESTMVREFLARGLVVCITAFYLTCVVSPLFGQAKSQAGNVLFVRGKWESSAALSHTLRKGDPLYERQMIRATGDSNTVTTITIIRLDGTEPKTYDCTNRGECQF